MITVSPSTATVNSGQSQQFTASSAKSGDITNKASWGISDATLGSVTVDGLFTASSGLTHGGVAIVSASYGGATGGATVNVFFKADIVDPSAPAGATTAFTGPPSTDASEMPLLVYPFSDTLLARNINQMDLQWTANAKDTIFRLHLVGPGLDASFYVGSSLCAGGTACQFKPKDADWQAVALSASGGAVMLTIDAVAAAGAAVASSSGATVNFSPEDVKGGLYYFSPTVQGLKRVPFGASAATDFTSGNPSGCVGCHSVSRDGKKVAAAVGSADAQAGVLDGADGTKFLIAAGVFEANFATFSPDGTQLLTNWAGVLTLRDGTTGAKIKDVPQTFYGGKSAVMPEWSPDGASIAFVAVPPEGFIGKDAPFNLGGLSAGDWITAKSGSIMVMPVNGGAFGMATPVAPSVMNTSYNFYPTWSPDSQWIVFATSSFPGSTQSAAANGVDVSQGAVSYDQQSARLRMVKASGGSIIELTSASHAMDRASTWPKFAPFVQQSGNLVFITFNARFAYGFVVGDNVRPQLWMSAIDLGKASTASGDPSFQPFWLPFQDPSQANHSGIWTTEVACTTGGTGGCPPEFVCENGECVPNIQ